MSQVTDSLSYGLGVLIGKNLQQQGFSDLNANQLADAIQATLEGQEIMHPEQAQAIVQSASSKVSASTHGPVKEEGEAFLAENAKRADVISLPSGLQYEILQTGDGAKPSSSDNVTTHYHGMLINGKVFDSSVDRGQPATFPVNGVIQGWQEILQIMPTGSKWKIYIPYDLAYGERGAGGDIAPFAALIFEIELLKIN